MDVLEIFQNAREETVCSSLTRPTLTSKVLSSGILVGVTFMGGGWGVGGSMGRGVGWVGGGLKRNPNTLQSRVYVWT